MTDASRFRDSTEIVLPAEALRGLRAKLEEEFTLTIVSANECVRIIGSPVEIKEAGDFLARHGVSHA